MEHEHGEEYTVYGLSPVGTAELSEMAQAGDAEAMVALGYCYENGIGVEKDASRAFSLYEASAEKGCANGIYNKGICIGFGIGTEKNPAGYFDNIKRAAEMGFAPAQNDLGWCYECGIEHGCIGFRDLNLAFTFYLASASQGHRTGIVNVVRCLREGIGTKKDEGEAEKWESELFHEGDGECGL